MDDLELGLDSENVNKSQGNQSIRRNISLKLKQTSSNSLHDGQKTSKREKAPPKVSSSRGSKNESGESVGSHSNRSAVQTSLSLSSLSVNHVESIIKNKLLKVDNKSNLIGEKVIDPLIHNCQICLLPILIYGRLMPCKHIFCFTCAKKTEKNCPRCNSNVDRIDQSALGTVFVCTVGGSKHGVSGCHRTYLSQRDLQSHIQCRHMNQRTSSHHHHQQQQHHHQQQMAVSQEQQMQQQQHTVLLGPNVMHPPPDFMGQLPPSSVHYVTPPPIYLARPPPQQQQIMMTGPPPAGHMINMQQQVMMIQQQQQQQQQQQSQQQHNPDLRMNVSSTQPQQQNIMVMAPRSTNLITVPIQDERSMQQFQAELHHQQQQQAAHFAHPAGAQFAANLIQQQQQQAQQQQNQQFLVGAPPQMLNHPPMVNQGHLRTQGAAGGRMVVPSQMNIHSFTRFEDPSHPTQFITATQGMATNAWIQNQRPPMAGQGQNAGGSNQQLQFY